MKEYVFMPFPAWGYLLCFAARKFFSVLFFFFNARVFCYSMASNETVLVENARPRMYSGPQKS